MKIIHALIVFSILLAGCDSSKVQKEKTSMVQDPHSFSNPNDARVKHLKWKGNVDFKTKTIQASATWEIETSAEADLIIFDTKELEITRIYLDNGRNTEHRISEKDSLLGAGLAVLITPETKSVTIEYTTNPSAEAVQWLEPQQTAGKEFPFLFTQSQAILARSWVPCQDSPDIRFTYEAEVTVPADMLALMSASNPVQKNREGKYYFRMNQPIPSYLLALTVGDIDFKPISDRCGIYAEPSMLAKAHDEFADLEKMVSGAEELYGRYQWERYDVIVLPPSFPFGGMENPRLTFATPTILAGDRSLTSLIAHELAHSWSGNLVTNATWNEFWLNEGFTVYFEHRIMEKLYGRDYSEMLASLSLQDLNETIKDLETQGLSKDTKLQLDLEGRNPDEGVTDIAYNKGYFFLRLIEETYGKDKFDSFLKKYFSENAFHSITTKDFISYIRNYYSSTWKIDLEDALFEEWIFSEGLPSSCPQPSSFRFKKVETVLAQWNEQGILNKNAVKEWSTHEWLHFLKNVPQTLTLKEMNALDQSGNFTHSGNAEIVTLWFGLTIRNKYTKADKTMEEFLINTGRRKFLLPLYNELIKTTEGKERAKAIYAQARSNYHFVATNTFDKLLQ